MNHQYQQPPEKLSMMEKLNRWEWLIWLPALSAAVLIRKDIGGRMLHRGYISGVSLVMFLLSLLALPRDGATALRIYAGVVFVVGFAYAIKRWMEFNQGCKQNSHYIGTSPFNFMPALFRRNRRTARFLDPMFIFLCGALLLPGFPAVGLWLMFAAICLGTIEAQAWTNWRREQMDMVDGLVLAEVKSETVEKFEQAPARQQRQEAAIATGLGDDIARKIEQKRRNQGRQTTPQ